MILQYNVSLSFLSSVMGVLVLLRWFSFEVLYLVFFSLVLVTMCKFICHMTRKSVIYLLAQSVTQRNFSQNHKVEGPRHFFR